MKVKLRLDDELTRCVAYIRDELTDALVVSEMRRILDDYSSMLNDTEHHLPDDIHYYDALKEAAEVILSHYSVES